jgi:hypothetical protein
VGDQPLSQKKQRLRLCFRWQGTGHAQCMTCVQGRKKKKNKERKCKLIFQLETQRGKKFSFEKGLELTVREERKIMFFT